MDAGDTAKGGIINVYQMPVFMSYWLSHRLQPARFISKLSGQATYSRQLLPPFHWRVYWYLATLFLGIEGGLENSLKILRIAAIFHSVSKSAVCIIRGLLIYDVLFAIILRLPQKLNKASAPVIKANQYRQHCQYEMNIAWNTWWCQTWTSSPVACFILYCYNDLWWEPLCCMVRLKTSSKVLPVVTSTQGIPRIITHPA